MEDLMRCPNCHKQGTFKLWEGERERLGVKFLAQGEICAECGEVIFDSSEVQRQEKLLANGIVERGVRTGSEFKFVRKKADLTAADVAEFFDVTTKTVFRWERGEAPLPLIAAFAISELCVRPRKTRKKLSVLRGRRVQVLGRLRESPDRVKIFWLVGTRREDDTNRDGLASLAAGSGVEYLGEVVTASMARNARFWNKLPLVD